MSSIVEQPEQTTQRDTFEQLSSLSSQDFLQYWVESQCTMIPGALAGVVAQWSGLDDDFKPVALWPEAFDDIDAIAELIEQVIEQERGLITKVQRASPGEDECYGIAYPIISKIDGLRAVAALLVEASIEQLQNAMRMLEWGCAWVELSQLQEQYASKYLAQQQLSTGVDVIAKVLSEKDYSTAAMLFVTELARAFKCDRVSHGTIKNNSICIEWLSNSAQFGKKMNLVSAIQDAMDEAVDQRETLCFPPNENQSGGTITTAHEFLSKNFGNVAVMSVPLYVDNNSIGALTFERDPVNPFSNEDVELAESVSALTIVALEEKRLNARILLTKIADSARMHLEKILGAGYLGRKIIVASVLLLTLFFSLAQGTYQLSVDAVLESSHQRVIAAPFEGYIKDVNFRAGDVVKKGQVLVSLDDRDLQLERLKWLSQSAQLNNKYLEAIAEHNRAQINVINSKLDQAKAQLKLAESDLDRSQIKAPFDGLLVSGDLSQRLGGSISQGEQLFELSPLDAYRINLAVKESRIADVHEEQVGVLYLSALPQTSYKFKVTKITPVAEVKDGATYFKVEAALEGMLEGLRPGMEGIGKIEVDERNLLAIWTRELMEWLRLQYWSWWG